MPSPTDPSPALPTHEVLVIDGAIVEARVSDRAVRAALACGVLGTPHPTMGALAALLRCTVPEAAAAWHELAWSDVAVAARLADEDDGL